MRLEDCTKTELICFIRDFCFFSAEELEVNIIYSKYHVSQCKAEVYSREANKALGDYIEVLRQEEEALTASERVELMYNRVDLRRRRESLLRKEKLERNRAKKLYEQWVNATTTTAASRHAENQGHPQPEHQ